jgi:geranylgeranyl diphosphate synthase type I
MNDFSSKLDDKRDTINKALAQYLEVGDNETLKKAMSHYPLAGGKRLRPLLSMVVADAVSGSGTRTLPFGCGLELVHNFTLVHDDIMDNDDMRRGITTVHKEFDMPTAIIAGDALFALAFEVISKTDVSAETWGRLVADTAFAVRLIAEGQQMDMEFEKRQKVSEAEYLDMIGKKTGILFSLATRGGALIANGTEEQVKDASNYGQFLGMGFQIKDDILGIVGDEKVLGKPVGSDIRNGKKTLIAAKAFETLKGDDKKLLVSTFGREDAYDEEIEEIVEVLRGSEALEYARKRAQEYSSKAKAALESFGESEHKKILQEFADFVISRSL